MCESSDCGLQMNKQFNVVKCEYEDINPAHQSVDVSTCLQSPQNCCTPLNSFVVPSQDCTQPDQLFVAQPTMTSTSGEFPPDLSIQHNTSHDGNNFKTNTGSITENKEHILQSVDVQGLTTLNRKIEETDNVDEDDDDILAEMNNKLFNSAYTDTVTSITSRQFLIKSSDHNKYAAKDDEVKKMYVNCGYNDLQSQANKTKEMESNCSRKENTSIPLFGDEFGRELDSHENSVNAFQHIEKFLHHHIIPVVDNDIISLDIQEIIPSSVIDFSSHYAKSANNVTVADESLLFLSQPIISESNKNSYEKRAATMQNLHEQSSFLNLTNVAKMGKVCQKALIFLKDDLTFGSLVSLNSISAKNRSNPAQEISLIDGTRNIDIIPSRKHRRNVIALSITITLLFIAMGSVRNLQSSLNQEGGVGIISMAVSFVGYMLGSIFSSSIVQNFQPRKCIVISLIPNLIYVAANIYPTVWLMAIVSLIQGISLAIIWNEMSTYITFLSRGRALKKDEEFERVSNKFFGIFCLIYQSYHVIGNLIASLVLMPGSSKLLNKNVSVLLQNFTADWMLMDSQNDITFESNALEPMMLDFDSIIKNNKNRTFVDGDDLRFCGANLCNHFKVGGSGVTVSNNTKFMLFGIYMGCIVVAIGIAAFILEPLNPRLFQSTITPAQKLKLQLISLGKFAVDTRFLLLLPILMYSVMQFGFISGEVTMAFITCPLGIHMVGYTMICFGVTASLCSFISGILCQYTGRIPQIVTAAAFNLAVLVFMTQWQPTSDSLAPYFSVMAIWGVSDGIWNCQVNSLMGVVFPDKYEEAYAGLRIAQGLGVAILFSYSNLVCMTIKIYIIASICVFAVLSYLIMEAFLKYGERLKQMPAKQTSV